MTEVFHAGEVAIQERAGVRASAAKLGADQCALIVRADTFVVASCHPERGADASHRGGRTLRIAGSAQMDWDSERIAQWDRAGRLVDIQIDHVVDRPAGLAVIWELVDAHRLNPAVPSVPSAQPSSAGSTASDSRATVSDSA